MNWPKRTSVVASPFDLGGASGSVHQRARGEIDLVAIARDGITAPHRLYRSGCLHVRLPRPEQQGWLPMVLMNSSGGIAAGDRLDVAVAADTGARVTIAAQAAERFYRAGPVRTPSHLRNRIRVADDAALEWLPQETILFDDASLDRTLDIDLASTAWFLGVETLVFGRKAMGETVRRLMLRDRIRLRQDGVLKLHDAVRMDGDAEALLARRAVGGQANALATLILVAPEAESMVTPLREIFAERGAEAGVSFWNGFLLARILGPTSEMLRGDVIAALSLLRAGRELPRVWRC